MSGTSRPARSGEPGDGGEGPDLGLTPDLPLTPRPAGPPVRERRGTTKQSPSTARSRKAEQGRRPERIWRPLAAVLAVLVAGYALIAVQGYQPQLGLDLEGGTSVVLTPLTEAGATPDADQLDEAVNIIRQRVDGIGVEEAEVVPSGDNIVVSVPGAGRDDLLETVGSTAQLRFRPVIEGPVPADLDPTTLPDVPPAPEGDPDQAPLPDAAPEDQEPVVEPVDPDVSTSPAAQGAAPPQALLAGATTEEQAPPAPPVPEDAAEGGLPVPPGDPALPGEAGLPAAPPGATVEDLLAFDCDEAAADAGTLPDPPEEAIVACGPLDEAGTIGKFLLGPTLIEGTGVNDANAVFDPAGRGWTVSLNFDGDATGTWADFTTANVGNNIGIVLDRGVVSAPNVDEPILGGTTSISGSFTQADSESLAASLRYGALPLTFTTSQAETVSPALGGDQLTAGLIAAGVGLLLVALYSLVYYRGLGLVTIASLLVAGGLTYAAVTLLGPAIGFRLTLAGVAGLVVSIGITADSFVVYFERIKDEMRLGRTLRSAADRAWPRAFSTILAADIVQFLAAAILYFLAIGAVQNFAFTLGLTTLIDVAVVVLFTRPLLALMARSPRFSSPRFTGLSTDRLAAKERPGLRNRRPDDLPAGRRRDSGLEPAPGGAA